MGERDTPALPFRSHYLQSRGVKAEAELLPGPGAAGGLGEPDSSVLGRDANAALRGCQPVFGSKL